MSGRFVEMQPQWEYKRFEHDCPFHDYVINELGTDGWELVSACPVIQPARGVTNLVLFFKRKIGTREVELTATTRSTP